MYASKASRTLQCRLAACLVVHWHCLGTAGHPPPLPASHPLLPPAGDAVFGLAPGCLGHSVYAPADLLVHMPANLSFEAAATAPTVYVTVLTAFQQGQGMGPGTKVGNLLQPSYLATSSCWDPLLPPPALPAAAPDIQLSIDLYVVRLTSHPSMACYLQYYPPPHPLPLAGHGARRHRWRGPRRHPSGPRPGLPGAGLCWLFRQALLPAPPGGGRHLRLTLNCLC